MALPQSAASIPRLITHALVGGQLSLDRSHDLLQERARLLVLRSKLPLLSGVNLQLGGLDVRTPKPLQFLCASHPFSKTAVQHLKEKAAIAVPNLR
jgi:hypothetical protein